MRRASGGRATERKSNGECRRARVAKQPPSRHMFYNEETELVVTNAGWTLLPDPSLGVRTPG
jgi:hypothetical protein